MFLDAQAQLANAQAFSGIATTVSTNAYDMGVAPTGGTTGDAIDISGGEPLVIALSVSSAAVVSAAETYEFQLIQSASSALTSPDVLAKYPFTNAQATSFLKAGGEPVFFSIPPKVFTKRFFGMQLVTANGAPAITCTLNVIPHKYAYQMRYYTTLTQVL